MPAPEAHAPFNFVPANDPICWSIEPEQKEATYSGSISIEIEALEPILESGKQEKGEVRRFIMRNGKPFIPGTGLKGVVRSLLEALSMSSLTPISPRRVFFRDLNNESYLQRFVEQRDGVSIYKSRAGYLRKESGKWCVIPCEWAKVSHQALLSAEIRFHEGQNGRPIDRLERLLRCDASRKGIRGNAPAATDHYHPPNHRREQGITLRYRKITQIELGGGGRFVTAGHMVGRHFEAVFYEPSAGAKPIPAHHAWDDFEDWLDSHKPRRDLFKRYQSEAARSYYTNGIPVFWIEAAGSTPAAPKLEAFGFSQLFCVPYKRSIESRVAPRGDDEPLSLAEQIFGYADLRLGERSLSRRGRVTFGAAQCISEFHELPAQRVIPGNPSATCLGLYLAQPDPGRVNRTARNHGLTTYDSLGSKLRGRKVYWHRKGAWGVMPPNPVVPRGNDNVSVQYAPLDKGVKFAATIVIDRLTKLELGGLVASIELPKGHAHKIGLGKAFGLGSARMKIMSFNVAPDGTRYRSLREHAGSQSSTSLKPSDCADLFREQIGLICNAEFERIPEIRELRALTNYEESPPALKTAYMALERAMNDHNSSVYANKPVLPAATSIAGRTGRP
jgi:CRISPR-associated protein (TIGR03986 family)